MVLEAEQDEEGIDIPLSAADYVLHFISFFWKVVFAFIPPRYVAWYKHMHELDVVADFTIFPYNESIWNEEPSVNRNCRAAGRFTCLVWCGTNN